MGLVFKKDGLYFTEYVYDDEKDEGEDIEKKVDCLLLYLNEKVDSIESGVTFRQFVRAFYPKGFVEDDIALMDMLSDRRLTEFLKELDQEPPAKERDDDDPLEYLEIYVSAEADKYWKDTEHDLSLYLGIHGFGTQIDRHGANTGKIPYALSYSHWGTFAGLPITINPKTTLCITTEIRKRIWKLKKFWSKRRRDYKRSQMEISFQPTLLQLIHDVFTDLAFCGSPSGRSDHNDMLKGRMDDIESGEATTTPVNMEEWFEVNKDE